MISIYCPEIHSRPTLRSSDLSATRIEGSSQPEGAAITIESTQSEASRRSRLRTRSEEHTSELQSLRHLVCRLLLEKKKTIRIKNTLASITIIQNTTELYYTEK